MVAGGSLDYVDTGISVGEWASPVRYARSSERYFSLSALILPITWPLRS
jgi:hypothetical protein